MTWQSGGGGSSYPGVSPDGNTPGGIVISGALVAGDADQPTEPVFSIIKGVLQLFDVVGSGVDGDAILEVTQARGIGPGGSPQQAVFVSRGGDISGGDYTNEVARVEDGTASAQPIAVFVKQGTPQFQVDGDGVRVHGRLKTGASAAHVLGSYSGNAVPIYDEAGTLLGYMPLYA